MGPFYFIFFSFFEKVLIEDLSIGQYFGLSRGRLWSRVRAPLSLGETRTDWGGWTSLWAFDCRPKELFPFVFTKTLEEHERRCVAGKTVEETRCARRLVVVFLLSLSSLLLFFVVAKRAKERPLTLFFSLLLVLSTNDPKTGTSRRLSLSLCEVDESLRRLARLSGVDFSPEIADAVIELCRANVSPVAIVSVLKSLAGRRREEHNSAMSSPL